MKSWPENGDPVNFDDLSAPLVSAARRFALTGNGKYNGLGYPHSAHICPPPNKILSPSGLKAAHKQGRDIIEMIVGVALQLGIEQGIRLERKRAKEESAAEEARSKTHREFLDEQFIIRGKPEGGDE